MVDTVTMIIHQAVIS